LLLLEIWLYFILGRYPNTRNFIVTSIIADTFIKKQNWFQNQYRNALLTTGSFPG
jgi:hypothetical protein